MNEILAIADDPAHDDALLAKLSRREADRVTMLIADPAAAERPEGAQRMAELLSRAEWVTGAVVVGVAAPADALDSRMFETVVHASAPSPIRRRWRLRSGSRRERATGVAVLSPGGAR